MGTRLVFSNKKNIPWEQCYHVKNIHLCWLRKVHNNNCLRPIVVILRRIRIAHLPCVCPWTKINKSSWLWFVSDNGTKAFYLRSKESLSLLWSSSCLYSYYEVFSPKLHTQILNRKY